MNQSPLSDAHPLAGQRVAVIVESQFIPQELQTYRRNFESYGATVDFVSRLWGERRQRFYSTVEPGVVDDVQYLDVSIDFGDVKPCHYAAIIAAANYTTVRLRYEKLDPHKDPRKQIREAPAVRFFYDAMQDTRIVKGAPCHALWLLTPWPQALRRRHVTCNTVVLADVLNAGAVYHGFSEDTAECDQVWVDNDLVTNTGWPASARLVDEITNIIVKNQHTPSRHPAAVTS